MAVMLWNILTIVTVLSNIFGSVNGNPTENVLNVPQVLLPYSSKGTKPTTFLLKAQQGCFRWSSTKPNVATITPIDNKASHTDEENEDPCSLSALITVKLKTPDEDSTVILAEEEGTGLILRCDVFVDSIHRIEIATTARELLLGESPEVFDVYGYDKEGNLFSSLGSENFEWSFLPVNEKLNARTVLRFLWFHDSFYETEATIYELEKQRTRGYRILVEGVTTGEAILKAKLSHPEYKSVSPSSVKLTVIDNIMLIPPDEYIMTHQKVQYSAQQLRRGNITGIILPSAQYEVVLVDNKIASLDANMAVCKGLKLGTTKVQLADKNMAEVSSARKPSANLHVVEPAKLGFAIQPGKLWILQTGKTYEMHVRIFDEENNRIKIDEWTYINSLLPADYFEIHRKSGNGSYFFVTAKKSGNTLLTATLDKIVYPETKSIKLKQVYGEQAIEIYDPVKLNPDVVTFPWNPTLNSGVLYKHQLKVSGGSGNYIWTSLNSTFVSVNKKGLISTGNHIGEGRIKVSDMKNSLHKDECIVKVLPPEEISFILGVVEAQVGTELELPLKVSAYSTNDRSEKIEFQDCRKMNLKVSFSDGSIFKVVTNKQSEELPDKECTSIVVGALKPGFTVVTASYTYADITLKSSISIAAYYPVKVIDPVEIATVTLGSSKLIVAENGPLPWSLDDSQYYQVMSAEEEDWVKIKESNHGKDISAQRNLHYFQVECTHLGEQLLTVEVGNKPTVKNSLPASSSATTRFSCAPPVSMKLVPQIVLPIIDGHQRSLESCKDENKRIPVRNQRLLRLNLNVYDDKGNLFDDVSSLNINWSTDDKRIGEIAQKDTLFETRETSNQNSNGGQQAYQNMQPQNQNGPLTVSAQLISYKKPYEEEPMKAGISSKANLMLVPDPLISPDRLSTYAHPSNKINLDVIGGTSHFVLKSNVNIARLHHLSSNKIMVTPQEEGQLVISLYDQCLDAAEPAQGIVTLSDVYSVRLLVDDKVELGQSINCVCQALDQYEQVINVADVSMKMKLRLKSSADIFDISELQPSSDNLKKSQVQYKLTGKSVGVSSLTCQAMKLNGIELSSKSEEVQVFSAIELEPKYVLLIVGSIFQVHSRGGPQPQSTTMYSLDNDTVADVNQAGLVTAKVIGKTILTGKAKGMDSSTGKEIVYSKDTVIIEVIQLKGFKILFNKRTIVSNAEVGILSVGITDEGPFTFASSPPYLQFEWSTCNHEVAVVDSIHYKAGVSVTSERDFRAILRTKRTGVVTIKLKVKVLSNDYNQVSRYAQLEDSLQVQVFDELKIIHPSDGKLLLPPNSISKIQTNRDQVSKILYNVLSSSCKLPNVENIIKISSGEVRSLSYSGIVNVQVISHEDFGYNQTAVLQIEVAPIASVTLVSHTPFIVKDTDRPSFPIGINALFGITLHDKMGRLFDVATVPLKYRSSRSDIIQIVPNNENGTLLIRGAVVGETILKVWDKENAGVSDYLRISITDGISPTKVEISLGQMICFKTAVNSESGRWSASSSMVSLNGNTGTAVASGSGSVMIYYNEGSHSTYTEATIKSATNKPYIVNDEEPLFVTNGVKSKHFKIGLHNEEVQCLNDATDLLLPFRCEAQWSDGNNDVPLDQVFDVVSNYIRGQPVCLFTTRSATIMKDRNIALKVILHDKTTKVDYSSQPTAIRFVPHFRVENRKLVFNQNMLKQVLDVYGSYSQLLGLKLAFDASRFAINKVQSVEGSHYRFEVSIVELPKFDEISVIKLHSSLTNLDLIVECQTRGHSGVAEPAQKVNIASESDNKSTYFSFIYSTGGIWVLSYTLIIATIILILILYHFITKNRRQAPVIVSSPYAIQHSPHSPPPYQYSPPHQSPQYTPSSFAQGKPASTTPQRTLFSVSQ